MSLLRSASPAQGQRSRSPLAKNYGGEAPLHEAATDERAAAALPAAGDSGIRTFGRMREAGPPKGMPPPTEVDAGALSSREAGPPQDTAAKASSLYPSAPVYPQSAQTGAASREAPPVTREAGPPNSTSPVRFVEAGPPDRTSPVRGRTPMSAQAADAQVARPLNPQPSIRNPQPSTLNPQS